MVLLIVFPHRHVVLPREMIKYVPRSHLMSEDEWRQLGVQQSQGWIHYMIHEPGTYTPLCSCLLFCLMSESLQSLKIVLQDSEHRGLTVLWFLCVFTIRASYPSLQKTFTHRLTSSHVTDVEDFSSVCLFFLQLILLCINNDFFQIMARWAMQPLFHATHVLVL